MRSTTIPIMTFFLLEALAAPSSNRNTGFIARRHRRHFRTNELQNEGNLPSSNSPQDTLRNNVHLPPSVSRSQPLSDASTEASPAPTINITMACRVLLNVYQSMDGNQWKNQEGWSQASHLVSLNISHLETLSCCNWFGVSCSTDGERIVALELPNNGVGGPISDSIYSLTDLQTLNLSSNPLRSTLSPKPMFFRVIDLSHASLAGNIAPSTFQSPWTKILMLSSNTLTGSIDVSSLGNLETLFLDTNYFSEVIMGSSQGKKWKSLVMYNNMIQMPLPDLSGAVGLERVAFGNNRFTGSVFDVSRMKNLMYLDLRANHLSGPFPTLQSYNLPNLKLLGLGGNEFTGTIELNDANHKLLVAPSTIQKCSIEMQNRDMVLPCENTPSSYPSDTWAGKCGIIQMCKKRGLFFTSLEIIGDAALQARSSPSLSSGR